MDPITYEIKELPLKYVKPDLLQPRKRYDPHKLEELSVSLRNEGMINLPIVERMSSKQYKEYITTYPDSKLKKKLLEEIEEGKTYYLTVVGHRRYIGALKAGYNKIRVKVTKDLGLLRRRLIQNHEDSQLSFTPWAKAKAYYELYQQLKELHEKNGNVYTLEEFSRYTGTSKETIRTRFNYVEKVSPEVKRLVEKEKTVSYNNAVLLANVQDKKKQFRLAIKYGTLPEKKLKELLKEPQTKLEFKVETLPKTDQATAQFRTIKDQLYKIIKMREMVPQLKKSLRSEEIINEYKKLKENIKEFEKKLQPKELKILQHFRNPKRICNETKHYEKLEKILYKAYLENERNKLEKDPKMGEKLIHRINLMLIDSDPNNPRGEYEEKEMENLTQSIKEVGLLNPILLEKTKGRYQIVVGHRRVEAAKRAGLKYIDSFVVEELPKYLRLYLQIVEDSQQPFTKDERANSLTQLYDLMSEKLKKKTVLTILEFSRRTGKSPKVVGDALRYKKMLSDDVKKMVEEELLDYSTAQPLTRMINPNEGNIEKIEKIKQKQY
ncbi:MAG: ParB/RepB/Spo0J family partition protein, partial [Candidatus Nanoarchaeia archaeon]